MPGPSVTLSESARNALDDLVRKSGMRAEVVVERAIDYYRRNVGANSPQSAPASGAPSLDRIVKTQGVCGGRACIAGTRITVWGLVAYRRQGASDEMILGAVQGLTPQALQAAWDYAAANPAEIDRDIQENEADEDSLSE